jgi:glycosyltransferase involved in cell wall biosynthesis
MHNISVIIPVYNSGPVLKKLIQQLGAALPNICEEFEVILINDGSLDDSWRIITELQIDYPWMVGINLMRNYGQHNALLCGIRLAQHEYIITMDDDLQHPPEEIGKLITMLDKGYDVVYGYPEHEQHGLWRNLASQLTKFALQRTTGVETARRVSAFRAFQTKIRQAFDTYRNPFVSIDVLLSWGTNRFTAVPVQHNTREVGESNYTFRKLVAHALNMITGFSTFPLQFASWMGFAFAIFGAIVLLYVIGRYIILGGSVPGFPFLASTIAIFAGVQLFALGIIGEYLARMYYRLMDRPSYVIRGKTDEQEGYSIGQ